MCFQRGVGPCSSPNIPCDKRYVVTSLRNRKNQVDQLGENTTAALDQECMSIYILEQVVYCLMRHLLVVSHNTPLAVVEVLTEETGAVHWRLVGGWTGLELAVVLLETGDIMISASCWCHYVMLCGRFVTSYRDIITRPRRSSAGTLSAS